MAVAAIARHHQPLSQSELAQELGVESPTIVPLINRTVALGTVERVTTDRDKRKRLLVVTDRGRPSSSRSKRWRTICVKRS